MSCKPLSSAACRFRLCAALLASGRFDIIITNTFDCRFYDLDKKIPITE